MAHLVTTPADEQLLLDLLNTTPVVNGEVRDELGDLAAARKWLAAHGQKKAEQEWRTLLELRPVLQEVVRGDRSPRDVAPFLEEVCYRPLVTEAGIEWVLYALEGRTAAAQVSIAWDAVRTSSPGRLRACANPDCRLFLIDRSKANGAKWCSMAVCGNRMKARRHYHRADDGPEQAGRNSARR